MLHYAKHGSYEGAYEIDKRLWVYPHFDCICFFHIIFLTSFVCILWQVQWSSLPPSFRKQLLTSVEAILPNLNNRELSNVFWALGKANVNYVDDLSADFKELLMDSLVVASGDLKLFDLESVFVGLGLMQVCMLVSIFYGHLNACVHFFNEVPLRLMELNKTVHH